ncbi:hypothetical protein P171DRAFT_483446 [Karstenula rhodostoma CBS 690.94]|uniref:Uncharacterized protein n=1 Tax=Karstenula rhodostoma CBS 690.94 TaxID=1392251 RepID=A0A9P4PNJ4_9PLEO|nr:hypothetical protein P171DRAFT_483446 [Karstenula rhodostoma CBS 690.94]
MAAPRLSADPFNCKGYQWPANSRYEPQRVGETEHVLEWQSVTGFIDWLNARYQRLGTQFQDPATTSNQQLSFCKYVIKYWDLHTDNNQASQYRFAINNGATMNPVEHLASVYPSNNQAHSHEFVLLQSDINAPAKANLWNENQIYAASGSTRAPGMNQYMRTNPRMVILRLRWMVGARKYLTDARTGNLLVVQKTRIHDKLAELDAALPQHQPAGFHQWDPTIGNLAALWDTYMDQAFIKANAKQNASSSAG